MARSRNIKPGFFCNDDLVELDFATRLLFVGLWTVADREGRLEDRPKKIKINVFPADNVDVESMLAQLTAKKFILRYEINGEKYVQITNWHKHQNPHHTEKHSVIPDIYGVLTVKTTIDNKQPQSKDGGNLADSLIPDSLIPDSKTKTTSAIAPPEGVTIQTWQDFQKLRKTQKAPLTQSAVDGIQREATKAGWSLDDAMRECCARGWRGFKADWVADKPAQSRYMPPQPNETVPAKQGVDPALAKIIADGLITKPMPAELRAKLQRN